MKHVVHIRRDVRPGPAGRNLAAAARAALASAGCGPGELTIVVTDSRRVRRLNARFAGEDRVTDVLAFPSRPPDSRSGRPYLGDVVISLPRARSQARHRGVPLAHEMCLLAAHGALHLAGHDHAGPRQRRRMWAVQAAALRRIGLDPGRLGVAE